MNSFAKKLELPFAGTQRMIRQIAAIDTFRGKWGERAAREDSSLRQLRQIATVQSIGSSTRIEGARLSDAEIESLVKTVKVRKFASRDEEEVAGYFDALEMVLDNWAEIPLRENSILQLHQVLLKYSSRDERHRGRYKALPNSVTATYPDGTRRVIFETTPPHLVGKQMQELAGWAEREMEKGEIHPLLITALFVYEFLSIHPFQDGNGRLSRLLTTLLLLRSGYLFVEYISFENQIEKKKKEYYRALMTCQQRRGRSRPEKIGEWVEFFLGSIQGMILKLERKYGEYRKTGGYLSESRRAVLRVIQQAGTVKLADVKKKFPGASENTLKKDLQYLVREKLLEKLGERKGSVYRSSNPG